MDNWIIGKMMLFANRQSAGKLLAEKLKQFQPEKGLVLGIPRGGVVTAKAVAERLGWPLSAVIVKKIGAPGQSELAVGAMSEDGKIVWEEEVLGSLGVLGNLEEREKKLKKEIEKAKEKVREYKKRFGIGWGQCRPAGKAGTVDSGQGEGREMVNRDKGRSDLVGKVVIIVDDGVATGSTALAAVEFTQRIGAKKVILATPVIAADTVDKLSKEADELVYLEAPKYFSAVGQFYQEFEQVRDEEVVKLI